jgi:hypothetical protein
MRVAGRSEPPGRLVRLRSARLHDRLFFRETPSVLAPWLRAKFSHRLSTSSRSAFSASVRAASAMRRASPARRRHCVASLLFSAMSDSSSSSSRREGPRRFKGVGLNVCMEAEYQVTSKPPVLQPVLPGLRTARNHIGKSRRLNAASQEIGQCGEASDRRVVQAGPVLLEELASEWEFPFRSRRLPIKMRRRGQEESRIAWNLQHERPRQPPSSPGGCAKSSKRARSLKTFRFKRQRRRRSKCNKLVGIGWRERKTLNQYSQIIRHRPVRQFATGDAGALSATTHGYPFGDALR